MSGQITIGSLCTGYGGLDLAVMEHFGASVIWHSEIDKHAAAVAAQRFPGIPNLGDLKTVDWGDVERPDILTAGYPCQPFSQAGLRKGHEDERHLWPYIADAVRTLRPRLVVCENVRNHLRIGFREVLADLADMGFDAEWGVVRASDAGAPHQRSRLFFAAWPAADADGVVQHRCWFVRSRWWTQHPDRRR